MSSEFTTPNPALLAAEHAKAVFMQAGNHADSPYDRQVLRELGAAARGMGFTDRLYAVRAVRGVSVPDSHDPNKRGEVSLIIFDRPAFEGMFKGYSKVQIGKTIGHDSMRALCLRFDAVKIGPSGIALPGNHTLHVPVPGVSAMELMAT